MEFLPSAGRLEGWLAIATWRRVVATEVRIARVQTGFLAGTALVYFDFPGFISAPKNIPI
ncbi:hypothetical protein N8198_03060 [Gammaproteobacteria bacterium]|nr:hypothetical protein [Gammaproteobacteria bacterium]